MDYIAAFKKTKAGDYAITVATSDMGTVIPGFRLYLGKLQAPAKKYRANWYPAVYFSADVAKKIYGAVCHAAPDGTVILPEEESIQGLLHNEPILAALEGVA